MKIKVCGMKVAAQIEQLNNLGVDYCGLIFFEGSKRWIGEKNDLLIRELDKCGIKKIGVFVNEKPGQVLQFASDYNLSAVQLHGNESPEYCRQIGQGLKLIKAFRLEESEDVDVLVSPFMDVADYFLFDNGKGGYGGTGEKFNWDILRKAKIDKPFFLSGGISAGDAEMIRSFDHPFLFAIDINSRFETSPGVKDLDQVEMFINAVNNQNSEDGNTTK